MDTRWMVALAVGLFAGCTVTETPHPCTIGEGDSLEVIFEFACGGDGFEILEEHCTVTETGDGVEISTFVRYRDGNWDDYCEVQGVTCPDVPAGVPIEHVETGGSWASVEELSRCDRALF